MNRPVPRDLGRWSWPGGVALLLLLTIWQVWLVGDVRIDDAYITFAFSRNVAAGVGPLFSAGARVEGYSNFLWMVLVAGPLALFRTADPYLIARSEAAAFLVVLAFATYALGRLRLRPFAALAVVALLFCHSDLFAAGLFGLETLPYVALVTAGFALYLHGRAGHERAAALAFPCLVLGALTRIDGFIPLGYALGWAVTAAVIQRRIALRTQIRQIAPALVIYGLWFTWRWHYYGQLWPSTVYAKELIPKLLPHRGGAYVRDQLAALGTVALLPFVLMSLRRLRGPAGFLALFVVLHLAYVARVGGDWMPYARFVLPVVPAIVVLAAFGVDEALGCVTPGRSLGRLVVSLAAAWAGLHAAGRAHRAWVDSPLELEKIQLGAGQTLHVRELIRAVGFLDRALPRGARLVTDYAGVFGYFSHAYVIDMWGLCTLEIARQGGTEGINPIYGKTCPRCYLDLAPAYFHVMTPLLRAPDAFASPTAVLAAVWQTDTIGRYLDFRRDFAVGRVLGRSKRQAAFFLERRAPGKVYVATALADGFSLDYPFEPATPGGLTQ